MKSGTSITLTTTWWKKERPEGLKKSGSVFEKALDDFAKAMAAAEKQGADGVKAAEKAIDAVESAAKQVVSECKDLDKGLKDKKDRQDVANTISVMGKPLAKELDAARSRLDDFDEDEDEDGGDLKFSDPVMHAAYLRKMAGKLRRGAFSFGLGMPSNDPADMRLNFHRKKGGRSLANEIKKAVGAKKFTFGIAGTQALAQDMGNDEVGGRTLVLSLEGRSIPGLAKRIKLMFRMMKISAFGRVVLLKDGKELDAADDTTDDTLDDLDLTQEDENEDEDAVETTTTETTTDEKAPSGPLEGPLRQRLAAIARAIPELPEGSTGSIEDGAAKALKLIESGKLGAAATLMTALEKAIGKARPNPEDIASFDPAARPDARAEIQVNTVALNKAKLLWKQTRAKLFSDMQKLENSIVSACQGDEELAPIAQEATTLSSRLTGFDERLEKLLDRLVEIGDGQERETVKQEASDVIGSYTDTLNEPFFQDVDNKNGFVSVAIASSANAALNAIRNTLKV